MRQYLSSINDRSYQSEAGSIEEGLARIINPDVVDIIWNFYKTNSAPELAEVARQSTLAVASLNTKMKQLVAAEYRLVTDLKVKYQLSEAISKWDDAPEDAVKYLFESLKDFSAEESAKKLGSIASRFVRIANDKPIKHLALYTDLTIAALVGARSDPEVEATSRIASQLAKWSTDPYDRVLQLYCDGLLNDAKLVTFINAASKEVNGTIGSTLNSIPSTSRESFFNVARFAKGNASPKVRAAAAELIVSQSAGEFLPTDLRSWMTSELPADVGAHEQIRAVQW